MSTTETRPRATEKFNKSFGGSLKSIIQSNSRTYFILEHKTNTNKFRIGETSEFMGDYVELGRGNSYAVNFGNDCTTVSRPHAAIIRKVNYWAIKPLSKTNPTLVNGRPVNNEMELHNGDTIQLSVEGPRLSFLQPVNNKVSNMGMTVRVKAFMNEAIRPYRTMLAGISVLFLIAVTFFIFYSKSRNRYYAGLFKEQIAINQTMADSIKNINQRNKTLIQNLQKLSNEITAVKKVQYAAPPQSTIATPASLQSLYSDVYFIQVSKAVITVEGEIKEIPYSISGTGFLLNDGRFVTARHVIEPWSYINLTKTEESNETDLLLNMISNNGGTVVLHFTAYSPTGTQLSFTSTDFRVDKSVDISSSKTDDEGNTYVFTQARLKNGTDWAVAQTSDRGQLQFDPQLSSTLPVSTKLYVFGYPFGIGVNSASDIKPTYSECQVSRDGLDNGVIDISGRGFDQGNSGGPAFVQRNNQFIVIGIVSAQIGTQGVIVPMDAIR